MENVNQLIDINQNPMPVVHLSSPEDVDGSGASTQSSVFDGRLVRIVSIDNALRVAVGPDPTAGAAGILIPAFGELWLPIQPGWKVAILGGKANICLATKLD